MTGKHVAVGAREVKVLGGELVAVVAGTLFVLLGGAAGLGGLAGFPDTNGGEKRFEVKVQIVGLDA